MSEPVKYLDPWWGTEGLAASFHETFRKQLELEVPPGHVMYGLPVKVIARGNSDDALFEILDGSGRVAQVHLTWKQGKERLPWPHAAIYASIEEWAERFMLPEHEEWLAAQ